MNFRLLVWAKQRGHSYGLPIMLNGTRGKICYISIVEIPQFIKLQTRKVDSLSLSHNKEILNINVKEECFNRFLL
jgi:hypothetical protein